MVAAVAANAEAAAGLLFPGPVDALYAWGVIAAVNAAACFWLVHLVRRAEILVEGALQDDD